MLLKPSVLAVAALSLSSTFAVAQSVPVPVVDVNSPANVVQSRPINSAAPARQQTTLNPNAEMLMLVEQLQEEVRFLRGQVEEQNHKMSKMERDQRDRYRDLDRRIMALTKNISAAGSASAPAAVVAEPAASSADAKTTASAASSVAAGSDYEAYDKAFKMVRARDFEESLKAFNEFIRVYTDSQYVPNAIFWTAEVYRVMTPADLDAAKESYSQLIAKYPRHNKAAEAHYKLGLTLDAQGDTQSAQQQMQKTIDLYPDESVARLASEYLKQ